MKIVLEETTIPALYKEGKMRRVQLMDGELAPTADDVVKLFASGMKAFGFGTKSILDAMQDYVAEEVEATREA